MSTLAIVLTALVAVLHLGFMVLEMVFWTRPLGRKVFGLDPQVARDSAKLAMNQGLYNGFLAAGLVWGLWLDDRGITLFFLGCVVVAGIFGAATVKRSILYVQALPALLAAVAVHYF
jgi:putative membrane protein